MRLIAAGLFVYAGLLLAGVALAQVFSRAPPWFGWIGWPAAAAYVLILIASAAYLFNPRGTDLMGGKNIADEVSELNRLGLIESTEFRAVRAFAVRQAEDGGLQYFLELANGRVLFLSGQYLYDYEVIDDDPALNRNGTFPCSEFIVHRHKEKRQVVQIVCGGTFLEPEVMAPPFADEDYRDGRIPEDGQLISGTSYDELKRARLAVSK
jgi:hypothetical protein